MSVSMNDRFKSPRPAFVPPSNPIITPTLRREDSKPLIKQDSDLTLRLPSPTPKTSKKAKTNKSEPVNVLANISLTNSKPMFTMAHLLTDEEFIRYTNGRQINDKGMRSLFYANGGYELEGKYSSPQLAFDALRQSKILSLRGVTSAEYKRNPKLEGDYKVYVPGGNTSDSKLQRDRATEVSKLRKRDRLWMGLDPK